MDPELIFDHGTKIRKYSTNIRHMFKQKNSGNMSAIINERNKPSCPRNIRNNRWTPDIIVNKIERNRAFFITNWKRDTLVFSKFTHLTVKFFNI